jgi:hypothetical protein
VLNTSAVKPHGSRGHISHLLLTFDWAISLRLSGVFAQSIVVLALINLTDCYAVILTGFVGLFLFCFGKKHMHCVNAGTQWGCRRGKMVNKSMIAKKK